MRVLCGFMHVGEVQVANCKNRALIRTMVVTE